MKTKKSILFLIGLAAAFLITIQAFARDETPVSGAARLYSTNFTIVDDLIYWLNQTAEASDNPFFKRHCAAIVSVIQAKKPLTQSDSSILEDIYTTFSDPAVSWNASELSSYLQRKRPFIVSWISPTDGTVSLAWLLLPENWDPDKTYPLYVRLHGLSNSYANPIEYLAYYLRPTSFMNTTFENGYSLFPWDRGNTWYEGIGETDLWESIQALESIVRIDSSRKYLMGFSMGGYGAWALGLKSPGTWAALGIYAGALWHGGQNVLNETVVQQLKDVPVYFVCGTSDGLLASNQTAHQMLQEAGNPNLFFTTFSGGHESRLECWQGMYEWVKNYSNPNAGMEESDHRAPAELSLLQNFPNPFNAMTRIRYRLSRSANVRLTVYDVSAKKIEALVDGFQESGEHEVSWNASNLPSGLYFCRLNAGEKVSVNKMILAR